MSIKVIDNFANIGEQLQIFNYINKTQNLLYLFQTSSYHPDIKNKFITPNTIDYPQIVHSIFMDDKILNVFYFLAYIICCIKINYLIILFIE